MNDQLVLQREKMKTSPGFLVTLDQSGGSTPKALTLYGVDESAYTTETEMFDLIHHMQSRIVVSPSFDADRVLDAILSESTMDRQIAGRDTVDFLAAAKDLVPFLKVDKGLSDEAAGAQMMKPMPDLPELRERARAKGVFRTKMRSVI